MSLDPRRFIDRILDIELVKRKEWVEDTKKAFPNSVLIPDFEEDVKNAEIVIEYWQRIRPQGDE
jgi:hypothetical protein